MIMAIDNKEKVLNVPNLRFPEFKEEWKKYKVSDVLDFYSTNSLSWEQLDYDNEDLYNLHYGLIHVGLPILVDIGQNKLPGIKTECKPKNFELCKEGDVAFADASEDTNDVAKAIEFVNLNNHKTVCGLHTIHGRDNKHLTVLGYKGYAFASPLFHNQIRRIAQGTKIYSISSKNFAECYIGIPSKDEQSKIARLLALIDSRIATQNKIIEQLQSLIKGIVVEHYNKSHKTKVKIKDLGKSYSVMNMSKEDLSETGNECIIYGELFTTYDCVATDVVSKPQKSIQSSTKSTGYDLLFPASTTVDAQSLIAPTAISQPNIILGGDMFGIVVTNEYNNEYLSYIFNYVYKYYLARYAQGSTIIHLHYNDIKNLDIELPDIKAQNELVLLLKNIQDKILTEKKMLSMLGTQKAYLLRNLFI